MRKEKHKIGGPPGKKSVKHNKEYEKQKDKPSNDYWDRVADDVASGYTTKNDDNPILNIDQEPGDDERGDDI